MPLYYWRAQISINTLDLNREAEGLPDVFLKNVQK